jgi:two-component system, OmpR family, response regulator
MIVHIAQDTTLQRMNTSRHVCLVDDDQSIRALLSEYLSKNGFRVGAFIDGASLQRFLARENTDLIILDVMLPVEDGFTICRRLKAESDVPIMMLSAKGEEVDRIVGLELGADDYVCKPFNPRELLARVRNLLRLTQNRLKLESTTDTRALKFHGWTLDTSERRLVASDGAIQRLSGSEYLLLHTLLTHANRVLTRNQIAGLMRGRDAEPFDRSIDVQISRLRHMMGDSARNPHIIRTIYGRGYVISGTVVRE